ncbi:hypothetical protein [Rhodococcus sp. 24CO]|uniref:hypothetical protein n=1 Tax=Rhodococcus sp. 24CO TaxID=3117460 RepID=UPI003D336CAF
MAEQSSTKLLYKALTHFGVPIRYKYNYCSESDGSSLAMTDATGRNGVDIDTVAQEWVHKADLIFADKHGTHATIT